MDVDPLPWILLAISIILIIFASGIEIAYVGVNRRQTREKAAAGDRTAQQIELLLNNPDQLLLSSMLLKTGGLLGGGMSVLLWMQQARGLAALILLPAGLWLSLAALQVLSRVYAQRHPDAVASALAPFVNVVMTLLWPAAALLQRMGLQLSDSAAEMPEESIFLTEAGLRFLIDMREEGDAVKETERQMIANILDMEETVAREIMVPRIDMVALEINTPLREALDVIIEAGHSRIPVYEESADNILGFLYAKDLLNCFQQNETNRPIRELLRPAYFVPVSKTLDTLFAEMQKNRIHIALVIDEYGGTAGLITIEDIIEEIMGDIEDEYDAESEALIQAVANHAYLLNARLGLDELTELLEIDAPEEDVDTLGGLIYSLCGDIPEAGESLSYQDWTFTVLTVDGRRIEQIRAERHKAQPPDAGDAVEVSGRRQLLGSNSLLNLFTLK
ncbi:MAG: HlyC/CorC family transporter [Caldilineaceae bacterium]|nr:HlyC/CorC family transporter [Caldilineaceae bacterium]